MWNPVAAACRPIAAASAFIEGAISPRSGERAGTPKADFWSDHGTGIAFGALIVTLADLCLFETGSIGVGAGLALMTIPSAALTRVVWASWHASDCRTCETEI